MNEWIVWRKGFRYVVARCIFTSWAGSGYTYARRGASIVRFWTKSGAQEYADNLNMEEAGA